MPQQRIKPLIIDKNYTANASNNPPTANVTDEPTPNTPADVTSLVKGYVEIKDMPNTLADVTPATNYSTDNHKALLEKLKAWNEAQTHDQ